MPGKMVDMGLNVFSTLSKRTLISKEEFVDETLLTNSIATKAVEFPEEIREVA